MVIGVGGFIELSSFEDFIWKLQKNQFFRDNYQFEFPFLLHSL